MDTSGAEGNGNMNDGYSQKDTESIRSALKTKTDGLVEAGIAITRQIGELPPRLYHYTDAQALMGIIDNQELWATHASFLNDTSELAWATKVYREVIAKIAFEDAEEKEFLRRIEEAVDFKNAHFSVYLCSFSEQGDDLSQWRGYGGQSNPVSIGFHALKLGLRFPHGELLSVIYDAAEQMEIADKIVSSSFQFFRDNRDISDKISMLHYMIECTLAFKSMATYSSLRFKAPHWHSEREWRLIFAHDYRDRETMPVSFRNGPYSIVPFLKAKVENPGMPIQQITAGPTANRQLAAEAISIYAGNRHISLFEGVSISEVSLR